MSKYTDLENWYEPANGYDYITTKRVEWEIGVKGSGAWLRVPAGFRFDVSWRPALRWVIDKFFWFVIDTDDPRFLKAACLHDYAIRIGWNRVSSAAAFSEALRAEGVGKLTRLAMVLAVIIWKWN